MAEQKREGDITDLLVHEQWDELMPHVYDELRRIAHLRLVEQRPGRTLDTRALVHEVFFKIVDQPCIDWQDRAHFFAIASQAMRWIIINYAKRRSRQKRGSGVETTTLDKVGPIPVEAIAGELLDLDRALSKLAQIHTRQSKIVECRFFGGLSVEETADALSISPATVKRDWRKARAWLLGEMQEDTNPV